jgi:hypothetical protein
LHAIWFIHAVRHKKYIFRNTKKISPNTHIRKMKTGIIRRMSEEEGNFLPVSGRPRAGGMRGSPEKREKIGFWRDPIQECSSS